MIKFCFKYDDRVTISVDNISVLSNKKILQTFKDAVEQETKSLLLHELASLREDIENNNIEIICLFDSKNQDWKFQFAGHPDIVDAIDQKLKG